MQIEPNQLYHIYNQGNNQQRIFFRLENYDYFLRLFQKHISPHCDLLAYCLMPNHFHFLIGTTEQSVHKRKLGQIEITNLAFGFKTLLSSYAQAINKQEGQSGSLFRQKTKAKCVTQPDPGPEPVKGIRLPFDHPTRVLHYIHTNPVRSGLVKNPEDWPFSSFREHQRIKQISFCNPERVKEVFYGVQALRLDQTSRE